MKILVVDDDATLNNGICTFLNSQKIKTYSANNGRDGLKLFKNNSFDLVLSDLQMPQMGGIELLEEILAIKKNIPVIIMTAFASVENAVEAMKLGAEDYLTKPINLQELKIKINKIVNNKSVLEENKQLRSRLKTYEFPEIIGESEQIIELKELIKRTSVDPNIPISIFGRSGTGKELVARNIHLQSSRNEYPFTPINCATLSDELLESQLFGYEKGAFTGANEKRKGVLLESKGGTIFLDEVGELSPRVQSKLLRLLQDGMFQPTGSAEYFNADVRFICASNKKLEELVEENKFREDLFYRLNVVEIEVPSLIARRNDIPILISHFIKKYDIGNFQFSDDAVKALLSYDWPGNIRELENLIRMLFITKKSNIVDVKDLPKKNISNPEATITEQENLDCCFKEAISNNNSSFEKAYLQYHLTKNNFNISKTAEAINISRISLHKKIKEYSLSSKEIL